MQLSLPSKLLPETRAFTSEVCFHIPAAAPFMGFGASSFNK